MSQRIIVSVLIVAMLMVSSIPSLPPLLPAAVLSVVTAPLSVARALAAPAHPSRPGWVIAYNDPYYDMYRIFAQAAAAIFLARALAQERIERAYDAVREIVRGWRDR